MNCAPKSSEIAANSTLDRLKQLAQGQSLSEGKTGRGQPGLNRKQSRKLWELLQKPSSRGVIKASLPR